MILKRRAALDTIQLDQVDELIAIRGIDIAAGKEQITAESLYSGIGGRVVNKHRESLDVTVRFGLAIEQGGEDERAELIEKIIRWAAPGGWLTTNVKPGRKIRVIAASLPGDGDPLDWTKDYAIVFRAYGVPYWQNSSAVSARATGSNSIISAEMIIDGTAPTAVDCQYVNSSGSTVDDLSLAAGTSYNGAESALHFSSLGLANGETLIVDHQDAGDRAWLRIRIKSTGGVYRSVLGARTAASSNDLTVTPGRKSIFVRKTGAGTLTATVNGRYL